ncbi:MAG TPA: DUF3037 domain-containing protein [Acidobacteriaceae bacterium]|nr:DUF3037 domain-containing protein [Acidobacteriaceae bacterium]
MANRKECEFQLIRYVPDAVKNEFVNIGVILRASGADAQRAVRFTKDWSRVRCIDPDADTAMLEALEIEIGRRLELQADVSETRPLLALLEDSLSNALQMTEAKAFLAESFITGLEQLLRLYVEPIKRERGSRRSVRASIHASMRAQFERAGVWTLLRKQIAASDYTRPGDPLRIDCGYRPNGVVRMFQAVALEGDAEAAKVLAFSARGLKEGLARVENANLELTAIIDPIRRSGEEEPGEERIAHYRFAVETMEEHEIRVLTTSDLPRIAETARRELRA